MDIIDFLKMFEHFHNSIRYIRIFVESVDEHTVKCKYSLVIYFKDQLAADNFFQVIPSLIILEINIYILFN